jgi:hypothetical protein
MQRLHLFEIVFADLSGNFRQFHCHCRVSQEAISSQDVDGLNRFGYCLKGGHGVDASIEQTVRNVSRDLMRISFTLGNSMIFH